MKGTQVESAGYIPESMRWETKFDKFMKQLNKKGITYAQWQKARYPITVSHKGGTRYGL